MFQTHNYTRMDRIGNARPTEQILYLGKAKLLITNIAKSTKAKTPKFVAITTRGAFVYRLPQHFSSNVAMSSLNKDKKLNTLQSLQTAESSFPIWPDCEVYPIDASDPSIQDYLQQAETSYQKEEHICFFCNVRDGLMFPLFFGSREEATEFHAGVVAYQLYTRYGREYEKIRDGKGQQLGVNIALLHSLGQGYANEEFVLDPELFSVIQAEQLELRIVRQSLQRFVAQAGSSKSSPDSSKSLVFSLRLKFKLVDSVSLSYLEQLVSPQLRYQHVVELTAVGCSINDKMLYEMLLTDKTTPLVLYQRLAILDLSKNALTDGCFVNLMALAKLSPYLSNIFLNSNRIKLLPMSAYKRQFKQNFRTSRLSLPPRLSTNLANNSYLQKHQPLFIQFLHSLEHGPVNVLSLNDNLIYDPTVLVEYIIQGVNVPLKYLSLAGNRFSEVDKIRMAKLIVTEVKDRPLGEEVTVMGLGELGVVDEEVFKYVEMLRFRSVDVEANLGRAGRQLRRIRGFTLEDYRKSGQPGSIEVELSQNKEWQLCDQENILLASNFHKRRKTSASRSQLIRSIVMSSSQARSDDLGVEPEPVTADTLKPTVNLLKQAYLNMNFSAIQLYKQLLTEYNPELMSRKIAPLFYPCQSLLASHKLSLLSLLSSVLNFEPEPSLSSLTTIISRLFRCRIEYHPQPLALLYQGTEFEQQLVGQYSWNVFAWVLYLRHRVEQLVEGYVRQGYRPMDDLYAAVGRAGEWVEQTEDDYLHRVERILTGHAQEQGRVGEGDDGRTSQKQYHRVAKYNYLNLARLNTHKYSQLAYLPCNADLRNLCLVQPKLLFAGFLIKYYAHPQDYSLEANTQGQQHQQVNTALVRIRSITPGQHPTLPKQRQIDNPAAYATKYNSLNFNPCIDPRIPIDELPTYQDTKLSTYPPQLHEQLQAFTKIVIAFIKFLQHSPSRLLPQTLQYLTYIITTITRTQDPLHAECLSTQFYLQLLTYNLRAEPEARKRQVAPHIVAKVIEYSSMYLPYSEALEEYIVGHLVGLGVGARLHGPGGRFNQMLSEDVVGAMLGGEGRDLLVPVRVQYNSGSPGLWSDLESVTLHLHILTEMDELLQVAAKSLPNWPTLPDPSPHLQPNLNFALFTLAPQSPPSLLLPSPSHPTTVYTLLQSQALTLTSSQLLIRPLVYPLFTSAPSFDSLLNLYLQIYAGFREWGSLLAMLDGEVHVAGLVVQCMVSEMLVRDRGELEGMAGAVDEGRLGQICQEYMDRLQGYCPKGTASTLSYQDRCYIHNQLLTTLTQLLSNPDPYPHLRLRTLLSFHHKCRLITNATLLHCSTTNQQVLITNYGLVHVSRLIYVWGIEWRHVFDVRVQYGEQGGLEAIVLRAGKGGRQYRVEVGVGADAQSWGNGVLGVVKGVAVAYLGVGARGAWRHVRLGELGTGEHQTHEESGPVVRRHPARDLPSLWSQLQSQLTYHQTPPSPSPPTPSTEPKPELQPQPQPEVTDFVSNFSSGPPQLLPLKQQTNLFNSEQPALHQALENSEIELSDIVKGANSASVHNDNEKYESEMVVTNVRKSGRRELPRRRSSKEK